MYHFTGNIVEMATAQAHMQLLTGKLLRYVMQKQDVEGMGEITPAPLTLSPKLRCYNHAMIAACSCNISIAI